MNVTLPQETRDNGTLYAVVYVHKAGVSPLEDSREVHYVAQLTTYITPKRAEGQRDVQKVKYNSVPVTDLSYFNHLHSEFSCGPAANTFLFVAPPEAESQSREPCVPLETSPVNHRNVRGLHLHQGGAPQ